jgi:hypothetical protein
MKASFSWGLASLLLLGLSVAYAQVRHTGHIDDTGKVAEAQMHAKSGHTITWVRSSGGGKPWFVKFTGKTPCSNGSVFGSDRTTVCQVNAVCRVANDASCIYPYSGALAPNAVMNDPDVIVDP